MQVIVAVYDKRTWNGMNTRSKTVENKEDAIAWAKTIKTEYGDTLQLLTMAKEINIQ